MASEPLEFESQLRWPAIAAVDWHRWNDTAVVAVVAQTASAPVPNGVADIQPAQGLCGSHLHISESPSEGYAIQVNQITIGQVPSRQAADQVASQIRQAVPLLKAKPNDLTPSLSTTQVAGHLHDKTVFVLPDLSPGQAGQSAAAAAARSHQTATLWVNNLRLAFDGNPLDPSKVQMLSQGLGETHQTFSGIASWYGPYFHGRQTATGETFNQNELTAAHKTLPFGTHLKVSNQLNGKSVVVRINDRGPYIGERSLDLSYAAAQCLGSTQTGVIPYQATILAPGVPQAWRANVVAALP
nr:septal ring lytic transglycosylase RlpA family protein [Nodosilinea sp. LEGE 07088]